MTLSRKMALAQLVGEHLLVIDGDALREAPVSVDQLAAAARTRKPAVIVADESLPLSKVKRMTEKITKASAERRDFGEKLAAEKKRERRVRARTKVMPKRHHYSKRCGEVLDAELGTTCQTPIEAGTHRCQIGTEVLS